ncbi:MAG: methyl-accepting chemotaxis protein [Desulfobacterales bacterium]
MKLSLRNRFLLPTVILITAGMIFSAFISYRYSKKAIEDMAYEQIRQLADSASSQISFWIKGIRLNVLNWSGDLTYKTAVRDTYLGIAARKAASEKMAELQKNYEVFETVVLFDKNGEAIASGTPEAIGKLKVSDREFFQKAVKGDFVFSEVMISRVTGNPIVTISAPVVQQEVGIEGVLTVSVNVNTLNSIFIAPIRIGKSGYAFIHKDGLVIAHPDKEKIMKHNISESVYGKKMLETDAGLITYLDAGTEEMAAFNKIGEINWSVVVVANSDELTSPAKKIRMANLLITFAMVGIVGILVFLVAGSVIRPLGAEPEVLSEVARRIAEGESGFKFEEKGKALTGVCLNMRQMSESLEKKALLAEQIAEGDLRGTALVISEKDMLGRSLEKMSKNLRKLLRDVRNTADLVAEGADQIAGSSQSLSEGTNEQASSLEEITSSLVQISSQTRSNAENASRAMTLAEKARNTAASGKQEMENMISAMTEISESSRSVAKIIKVIDEIAFQTNLLSLNAAVEAARAGRYGKGFAVVAGEVRNLAGRSSRAAKDTAELIESALKKVENGNRTASQTAASLDKIVASSVQMADLINEIAAASEEQARGIEQVSQGLNQVDQVTQHNAATAQETASSANELSAQAEYLRKTLSRFRLRERGTEMPDQNAGLSDTDSSENRDAANADKHIAGSETPPSGQQKEKAMPGMAQIIRPGDLISFENEFTEKYQE